MVNQKGCGVQVLFFCCSSAGRNFSAKPRRTSAESAKATADFCFDINTASLQPRLLLSPVYLGQCRQTRLCGPCDGSLGALAVFSLDLSQQRYVQEVFDGPFFFFFALLEDRLMVWFQWRFNRNDAYLPPCRDPWLQRINPQPTILPEKPHRRQCGIPNLSRQLPTPSPPWSLSVSSNTPATIL